MIRSKAMCCSFAVAASLAATAILHAQAVTSKTADIAVTFTAERSLKANTNQNFFTYGGSAELGVNVYRGLGIAANVTGTHTSSVGTSNIPLSLVTVTFGPRYRLHVARKLSVYGEVLVGEANGFSSIFPATGNSQDSANGLALQLGGGVDYRFGSRYALRLINASYLRTQLPNSADNVENNLQLGAGFVLRFR